MASTFVPQGFRGVTEEANPGYGCNLPEERGNLPASEADVLQRAVAELAQLVTGTSVAPGTE
jgi:hypothetical protein